MCLFPKMIKNKDLRAYKCGLRFFECGTCPECLSKKASTWAVRAYFESLRTPSCMITLTYNDLIFDRKGQIVGERDPSKMQVDKRDCQLFLKRLRKAFPNNKIKYILTAEYGKRTHRPHYHAILFGVEFKDAIPYKRSKRGNLIYMSPKLSKIWGNGIVTIDAIRITPAVVKYCTKYCVKDFGNDNTFMLFSHEIGKEELLRQFNGKYYQIEGKKYVIPRFIWNHVITERYKTLTIPFSYKYKNRGHDEYFLYEDLRVIFRRLRNNDAQYRDYLAFWKKQNSERPYVSIFDRISRLDNAKYFAYKCKAFYSYSNSYNFKFDHIHCPRVSSKKLSNSIYAKLSKLGKQLVKLDDLARFNLYNLSSISCHMTTNDTKTLDYYTINDNLLKDSVDIELDYHKLNDYTRAERYYIDLTDKLPDCWYFSDGKKTYIFKK